MLALLDDEPAARGQEPGHVDLAGLVLRLAVVEPEREPKLVAGLLQAARELGPLGALLPKDRQRARAIIVVAGRAVVEQAALSSSRTEGGAASIQTARDIDLSPCAYVRW